MSDDTPARDFPWAEFLAVRARLIDYFHRRGDSDAEIAATFTMDAVQVTLIRTRNRMHDRERGFADGR